MIRYAVMFVAVLACSKSSAPPRAASAELPKLGLSIDLDGKTAIADESYGNGYVLRNPALGAGGALHVAQLQTAEPPDGQKEEREGAGFTHVVLDRGGDGWIMTFERTDATLGATFFVVAYRDLGGKHTECKSTGILTAAAHRAAIAACKSLRATR